MTLVRSCFSAGITLNVYNRNHDNCLGIGPIVLSSIASLSQCLEFLPLLQSANATGGQPLSIYNKEWIDDTVFHEDVNYLEGLWQRRPVGDSDLPLIDIGDKGAPALVFVPILEHLEFVYARQVRSLSASRRVILYRRHETRHRAMRTRRACGRVAPGT